MKKLSILPIAILVIMVSFSSCKKMNSCETWEVRVDTYDTGCNNYYVSCNGGSTTYRWEICGDDLKDAKSGRVISLNALEGSCCRITKTYVRKL